MPSLDAKTPSSVRALLVVLAVVFAAGIALIACRGADNPSEPSVVAAPDGPTADASQGAFTASAGDKVKICHRSPANPANVQAISVPQSALPVHYAHGDYLWNAVDVPGNGIDENCNGEVDGGLCPCPFDDVDFTSKVSFLCHVGRDAGQLWGIGPPPTGQEAWINYGYRRSEGSYCNAVDDELDIHVENQFLGPDAIAACTSDFARIVASSGVTCPPV